MKERIAVFLLIIIGLGILSVYYPYLTGEKEIGGEVYGKEWCFVDRGIIEFLGVGHVTVNRIAVGGEISAPLFPAFTVTRGGEKSTVRGESSGPATASVD